MDLETRGRDESLIPSAHERTALRTHQLLVASRLVFVFSHGVFVVCGSLHLSRIRRAGDAFHELSNTGMADTSWWSIFFPVWLGDVTCLGLVLFSWFASCPYIKLCLAARQARFGDNNPSILTELLPEIVMAVPCFVFMVVAFTAEFLLCRYLDLAERGQDCTLVPSAVLLCTLGFFACCRGVCIKTSGDMFLLLGAALLGTTLAAVRIPGGIYGAGTWVLVLPALLSVAGFLLAVIIRLQTVWEVLSRQERRLRIAEQVVGFMVLVALGALALSLAEDQILGIPPAAYGIAVGVFMCAIAALRVQMAIAESRSSLVDDRITSWQALRLNPPVRAPAPQPHAMRASGGYIKEGTTAASQARLPEARGDGPADDQAPEDDVHGHA